MLTPHHEREYWNHGLLALGVDEAGRGALAGPVVAAAVVFPVDGIPDGMRDSKKLTSTQRSAAAASIRTSALAWSVAMVHHDRIDRVNILQATFDAMHIAMDGVLSQLGDAVNVAALIDGNQFRPHRVPSVTVIGGDGISPSIAAASILAKTERDAWMINIDHLYPVYAFAQHKGYATGRHRAAILEYGPCDIHRRTFLRALLGQQSVPFEHA